MSLDSGYVEYDEKTKKAKRSPARRFQRGFISWVFARENRAYRDFVLGLPAVIAVGAIVWILFASEIPTTKLEERYRELATTHFDNNRFDTAELYLDRLQRLGEQPDKLTFSLATVLVARGDRERAEALFDRLSPNDRFGYPQAHLRKAEKLLNKPKIETANEARRILHHLQGAQRGLGLKGDLNFLYATYYVRAGQPRQAVPFLRNAARVRKELYFDLGVLHEQIGQMALAETAYQTGRDHFLGVVERNPEDINARLMLGAVLAGLGEITEAYDVIEKGMSIKPSQQFVGALCQLCILKFDRMARSKEDPIRRLRLLERALELNPEFTPAINRLVQFDEPNDATQESREQAEELLQQIISTGTAAPIAHLALGFKAWKQDNNKDAQFHFERAYELDSDLTVIANNLAWSLAHDKNPDLDRALSLIDGVVKKYPNTPQFRDTRGQILVKLERWKEALNDLEVALPAMRDNRDLHLALSRVYEELGQESLARLHASQAKRMNDM